MDDGSSVSDHPILLLIPVGMLVVFVLIWLLVTAALALASGWFRLAKAYPDRAEEPMLHLQAQSGLMGPGINLRGVLQLSVCPSGLRLGIARILGPFSHDFLVPWGDISVSRRKALVWHLARLQFGTPQIGVLTLRASIADRLAQAAGDRWPESVPPQPET